MKKVSIIIFLVGIILIAFCGWKSSRSYSVLPTIYYDGQLKELTCFNTDKTDFFSNFKDMMPGDVKKQEILFEMKNIRNQVKILFKINENIDEKLLESINMKLYINDNELINNNDYIELGTFNNDSNFKLSVVVEIDKYAGNEIENLQQNMSWEFLIQEENGELIKVPYTYENNNIAMLVVIVFISLFVIIYDMILLIKEEK